MTVVSAPEVHTFPSDDERFGVVVAGAMMVRPRDPDALADLLRHAYPAVTVRARDPLAELADGVPEVWYAFRDGEVVGAGGR